MKQEISEINTAPKWRIQFIRALQIVGTAAATVGAIDLTPWLAFLDPSTASILLAAGLFARVEAPDIIDFIGDLADNGKLDGSFQKGRGIIPFVMLALCGFMLTSCGLKLTTPDEQEGCYLFQQEKDGKIYSFGPCSNAQGEIYAYRAEWTNEDGIKIRSTYIIESKITSIEYLAEGGFWVGWSSKSGIILDAVPMPVNDSDHVQANTDRIVSTVF